jgi:hypothetical protein
VVIHASAELEKTYYNNQRSFVIRCSVTVVILYIVLKATSFLVKVIFPNHFYPLREYLHFVIAQ